MRIWKQSPIGYEGRPGMGKRHSAGNQTRVCIISSCWTHALNSDYREGSHWEKVLMKAVEPEM